MSRHPGRIRRFLGRAAFGGGILAWLALLAGQYAREENPANIQPLTIAAEIGFVLAIVTLPLGAVAVIVGPYRLAALCGVVFAVLFFLYYASLVAVFSMS